MNAHVEQGRPFTVGEQKYYELALTSTADWVEAD